MSESGNPEVVCHVDMGERPGTAPTLRRAGPVTPDFSLCLQDGESVYGLVLSAGASEQQPWDTFPRRGPLGSHMHTCTPRMQAPCPSLTKGRAFKTWRSFAHKTGRLEVSLHGLGRL